MFHLDKEARETLERILVCKVDDETHHEANDEEDVRHHEPGHLQEDGPAMAKLYKFYDEHHLNIWTYFPNLGILPTMNIISHHVVKQAQLAE